MLQLIDRQQTQARTQIQSPIEAKVQILPSRYPGKLIAVLPTGKRVPINTGKIWQEFDDASWELRQLESYEEISPQYLCETNYKTKSGRQNERKELDNSVLAFIYEPKQGFNSKRRGGERDGNNWRLRERRVNKSCSKIQARSRQNRLDKLQEKLIAEEIYSFLNCDHSEQQKTQQLAEADLAKNSLQMRQLFDARELQQKQDAREMEQSVFKPSLDLKNCSWVSHEADRDAYMWEGKQSDPHYTQSKEAAICDSYSCSGSSKQPELKHIVRKVKLETRNLPAQFARFSGNKVVRNQRSQAVLTLPPDIATANSSRVLIQFTC